MEQHKHEIERGREERRKEGKSVGIEVQEDETRNRSQLNKK